MEKQLVCRIASSFLYFSDLVDGSWHAEMMNAITGAGRRMRNVPLQLQIWCSCITQRKRASMVPVKMTGVHLTCYSYVRAQKLGLSNFVKLTSNAFALSCLIFAWFEPMLTRRVTRTLTLADSLRNGLKRERICGHWSWTCSFSTTTASSIWIFMPNWAKSNIRRNRKQHWRFSKHSSCSKSSYWPAAIMIGPHQLPRRVLAPFFLPRHHRTRSKPWNTHCMVWQ